MEMMVASAVTAHSHYRVTGDGYASEGEVLLGDEPAGASAVLARMGTISALCNDSELRQTDGVWKVVGDPTEAALYPFAKKLGLDLDKEKQGRRRIDAIPFESEHKFMATLHEEAGGGRMFLVKGAPEVILAHCDRQETENGPEPLRRDYWTEAADRLAAQGERVLGLAWQSDPRFETTNLSPGDLPKTLVLLGLVGLMDPPRKEAIEAVAECHKGGIRVTMITGDHKITAAAIAKMLGIGDGRTAVAGAEIEAMNDAELQETVKNVDVFARASPEHKLRLVKAIQANGQVVAMTGDGVNDAPALKRADIGVAMGIKGTEVTKEAAAMVLADDNFASITAAVREGRTVFNNIEKALLFMLPTNVAQALVILVAIVAGFMLPITAPQILWVNMVTSVALGLVISFEPHEIDVMERAPRAVSRPILDAFAVWRVIFVGLALLVLTLWAFFWMRSMNVSDELARTVAVNTLVVGQAFYLLNSRFKMDSSLSLSAHLGNPYLPAGVAAVVVLQLLFTYAPPFQRLFGTQGVPLNVWPWLFLGGLIFFLVVEAEKFVIRTYRSKKPASAVPETSIAAPSGPAADRGVFGLASRHAGTLQALLGALAVLGLVAGEVFLFLRQSPQDYATERLDRGAVRGVFSGTGVVDAPKQREVRASVSGRVASVLCESGARVKAGQVCVKFDPRPYEVAVAREEARLAAALKRQESGAAGVLKAKADLERRRELAERGAASRASFDKARANHEAALKRAAADEAAVAQSRAALEAVRTQLSRVDVVAPIDGTVVSTGAAVGKNVEADDRHPLFLIAPTDDAAQLKIKGKQERFVGIEPGRAASLSLEGRRDRLFPGTVSEIAPSTLDATLYEIVIAAPDPERVLRPGQRVDVTIRLEEGDDDALRVSARALDYAAARSSREVGLEAVPDGWVRLWVLRDGAPSATVVRLGPSDGAFAKILEGNLSAGALAVVGDPPARPAANGAR
jgi:RND family efflux transporter MFP subunit